MEQVSVAAQVERVLKPIQQFVRGWMMSEPTTGRALQLGLRSGRDFWIIGRAGAIGDCGAAVAASGLAFLAPAAVADAWANIPAGHTAHTIAIEYSRCCTEWGGSELRRFGEVRMGRLDELGRRIADAADGSLGALFAGWRAMPVPDDVGGRAALTCHVLRELRGAAHIVAIAACGLTPLDAVLASPAAPPRSGPQWARHLEWDGPFRDPEGIREARLEAEQLTSRVLYGAFGSLAPGELAEFAELVETTRAAIDM